MIGTIRGLRQEKPASWASSLLSPPCSGETLVVLLDGWLEKQKNRENKVRRALMRQGFILQRDRTRNRTLMHQGHYRVVSIATGNVAFGEFYDWTIDDIEAMVNLLSLREFLHARSREAYPRTMLHAR